MTIMLACPFILIPDLLVFILDFQTTFNVGCYAWLHDSSIHRGFNDDTWMDISENYISIFVLFILLSCDGSTSLGEGKEV